MTWRILSGGAIAALAGAAMLAAASDPSPAFTLEFAVARASGRGRRHRARVLAPLGLAWRLASRLGMAWRLASLGLGRRWGLASPGLRLGYGGPVRRCWIGRWGYRHCAW